MINESFTVKGFQVTKKEFPKPHWLLLVAFEEESNKWRVKYIEISTESGLFQTISLSHIHIEMVFREGIQVSKTLAVSVFKTLDESKCLN